MRRNGKHVNMTEACQIFGKAEMTIRGWIDRGCPYIQKGDGDTRQPWILNTVDVLEWYVAQQMGDDGESSEGRVTINEAKRRKEVALAEKAEIENAVSRGELVQVDWVIKEFSRQLSSVRTRLYALPSKLAPLVAAISDRVEIQQVITTAMDEVANELTGLYTGDGEGEPEEGPGENGSGAEGFTQANP
jgi:phage terminase Nu1 subunit (DNA packaging protein)